MKPCAIVDCPDGTTGIVVHTDGECAIVARHGLERQAFAIGELTVAERVRWRRTNAREDEEQAAFG